MSRIARVGRDRQPDRVRIREDGWRRGSATTGRPQAPGRPPGGARAPPKWPGGSATTGKRLHREGGADDRPAGSGACAAVANGSVTKRVGRLQAEAAPGAIERRAKHSTPGNSEEREANVIVHPFGAGHQL